MPSPHFTLCYAAILSLGSSFSSVNRHTAEADQRDRHQRDPQPHIAVIAGLGGRILPAAVLCPLGIERDVLCGEHRVIARPGGLAFGVIAPAAEHIAVARGGRLDADRDLTVDLTRDRFRTVQCAAVGVKGDCGRCSL